MNTEPISVSSTAGREELYEAWFPVLWRIRGMLRQCPHPNWIGCRSECRHELLRSGRRCRRGHPELDPTWSIHDWTRPRKGTGSRLRMWCREYIRIACRGSIHSLLVVPTVYRCLESFLSGVVQEGWALARSMLAGFKWVRAEICLDSQSDLAKASARLADDNFASLDASDGIQY